MHKHHKRLFKNSLTFLNIQVLIYDLSYLQEQSHNRLITLDYKLMDCDYVESFLLLLCLEGLDDLLHLF